MDNLSNSDENYDLGYQPSPSSVDQTNHSPTGTTGFSVTSSDSFAYFRTSSEVSDFSEQTDDWETPSPVWMLRKTPNLSILRTKNQHKHLSEDKNDNPEPVDLGKSS